MNENFHDTLFKKDGGVKHALDESCILLKKRHSSVVYCPDDITNPPGAMYPRAICLKHNGEKNGTILATFEFYTKDTPVFPIYESTDSAESWHLLGQVEDKELGFGCRYQPHLYELPRDFGTLKEGTILCAGNIIPSDYSETRIRLYKSEDGGASWEFMSEIDAGGGAMVDAQVEDGKRPVWEPFITLTKDGKLICFYSDERYAESKKYNQLLAHKTSRDGYTWSEEVIDVAYGDGSLRPGMPVIAELPNGKYVMIYEMVNQDKIPVYIRVSDSIEDWGETDFMGNPVICEDGSYITGTPYIIWIPQGGEEGTLLVTGRGFSHILANSNGGRGFWEKQPMLIELDNRCGFDGYSQCLVPLNGGKQILSLCPQHISRKKALIQSAVADVYVKA